MNINDDITKSCGCGGQRSASTSIAPDRNRQAARAMIGKAAMVGNAAMTGNAAIRNAAMNGNSDLAHARRSELQLRLQRPQTRTEPATVTLPIGSVDDGRSNWTRPSVWQLPLSPAPPHRPRRGRTGAIGTPADWLADMGATGPVFQDAPLEEWPPTEEGGTDEERLIRCCEPLSISFETGGPNRALANWLSQDTWEAWLVEYIDSLTDAERKEFQKHYWNTGFWAVYRPPRPGARIPPYQTGIASPSSTASTCNFGLGFALRCNVWDREQECFYGQRILQLLRLRYTNRTGTDVEWEYYVKAKKKGQSGISEKARGGARYVARDRNDWVKYFNRLRDRDYSDPQHGEGMLDEDGSSCDYLSFDFDKQGAEKTGTPFLYFEHGMEWYDSPGWNVPARYGGVKELYLDYIEEVVVVGIEVGPERYVAPADWDCSGGHKKCPPHDPAFARWIWATFVWACVWERDLRPAAAWATRATCAGLTPREVIPFVEKHGTGHLDPLDKPDQIPDHTLPSRSEMRSLDAWP